MSKDGNMPQLRFNEDGEWHDFAPEGGVGLKAGPWFPFLQLVPADRLSDHRVGLDPAGWACDEDGEIKNAEPQCKVETQEDAALFKHAQSLEAEYVWRMKVVARGGARVGIAAEGYDVERHGETVWHGVQRL